MLTVFMFATRITQVSCSKDPEFHLQTGASKSFFLRPCLWLKSVTSFLHSAQAIHLRKFCCPRLAGLIVVVSSPALVLGTELAFALPTETLQTTLGVLLTIILLAKFKKGAAATPPPPLRLLDYHHEAACGVASQLKATEIKATSASTLGGGPTAGAADSTSSNSRHALLVAAAAACSGSLMGLCSVNGPPMMVLLTFGVSVEATAWRATSAAANLAIGCLQAYLFLGVHGQFHSGDSGGYAAMVAGGLCGLALGNTLAPHVDGPGIQRCMIVFLAMGSASMVTASYPASVQLGGSVVAALASVGALAREMVAEDGRAKAARARADGLGLTAVQRRGPKGSHKGPSPSLPGQPHERASQGAGAEIEEREGLLASP